jgi:hypothetical protein
MSAVCRICGQEKPGIPFEQWVKPTFTNYDQLFPGSVICDECLFWFEQRSAELQRRMGKDKPQRMQKSSLANGRRSPRATRCGCWNY